MSTNPWNLTDAEARAMDALIEHGTHQRAADSLARSIKTVEYQIGNARRRMGARVALHALLEWDRWRRGAK